MQIIKNISIKTFLAFFALMCLQVVAHSEKLEPNLPDVTMPPTEGFLLSIQTEKKVFALGEPIVLKVALINESKQPLSVDEGIATADYKITLKKDDQPVQSTQYAGRNKGVKAFFAIGPGWPTKVDSGHFIKHEFLLNRLRDMTLNGVYTVSVQRFVPKLDDKTAPAVPVISNTLQITIADPAPSTPVVRPTPREAAPTNTQNFVAPVSQWKIGDSWNLFTELTNDKTQLIKNAEGRMEPHTLR